MWVYQYGRDRLGKDVVNDGTLQEKVLQCWHRVTVEIGTTLSVRIVVDSFSGYSPDTDKCIKFSNRCCRLQPHPLHDKVVVVTLVPRSRCAPTPLRADARPRRLFWTSSKTIGEVWRSVRIFHNMPSSITFPTRPLHEVHVQSILRQGFVPFWPIFWVVRGSTWQIVCTTFRQ